MRRDNARENCCAILTKHDEIMRRKLKRSIATPGRSAQSRYAAQGKGRDGTE